MEPTKKVIKQQLTGKLLTVIIDKKKYSLSSPDNALKLLIKKEIEKYNKKNSDLVLSKIIKLLTPEETKKKAELLVIKKQVHKQKKVVKGLLKASKKEVKKIKVKLDPRFEVTAAGAVRLKGYAVDIPEELVREIYDYQRDRTPLEPLINFWMLAMLNPNPIARDKMFGYLSRHKLILTPNGYFVTYRMVKTTDNPKEFTHAHHSAGKRLIYRPGTVARIPRSECDEDGSVDCSRGLHTGTPAFIGIKGVEKETLGKGYDKGEKEVVTKSQGGQYGTGYDYSPQETKTTQKFDNSFGNQAIICLVNPMHVVSVPNSDTRKMRSCEFYFCKLTTPEEVIDLQTNDYHIFDHKYKQYEVEELKKMLASTNLKNITKLALNPKAGKAIEEQQAKLDKFSELMKERTGDSVSKQLKPAEIQAIIAARVKKGT